MALVRLISLLIALLVVVACGAEGAATDQGGRGSSSPLGGCTPGEWLSPEGRCQSAGLPPDMPCPPGERSLADGRCQLAGIPPEACAAGRFESDGRRGCEAILPKEACPAGTMAVPGERTCREVSPCGDGAWGNIPVEPNTQYVDPSYSAADSDGSRQKPWKTVRAGIRNAASGAIVALAEGRYVEDVLIFRKPVRLWGRCPARTEVVGQGMQSGTILVSDAGADGSEMHGFAVTGTRTGVFVQGARRVVLDALWVHDAGDGGVVAIDGSGVTLRGVLLERNRAVGAYIGGSAATVEGTVARGNRPSAAGVFGYGISVEPMSGMGNAGQLSIAASLIEQNHDVGVMVLGSEATVEGTVVRETQPSRDGEFGHGIRVRPHPRTGEGGKLRLAASLLDDNRQTGLYVFDSEATVETTVVRATQIDAAGENGYGIVVRSSAHPLQGAKLSLTSSLVDENQRAGVLVEASEATVEATVVRATGVDGSGIEASGIFVQPNTESGQGGKLSVRASLLEENRSIGIQVSSSEATVEATVVRATQLDASGRFGVGMIAQRASLTAEAAKLSVTSSLIEQNHSVGVYVVASEATVETTVVRATQLDGAGRFGRGIDVEPSVGTGRAARLWLKASLVEENHEIGVFVSSSEATVEATVVRATKPAPAGEGYGDGIMAMHGARAAQLTLTATELADNARAGVLYVRSTGELSAVRASGNRFGLVVQLGDSGVRPELGEANVFEGNEEQDKLDDGDLPVPDAALPLP